MSNFLWKSLALSQAVFGASLLVSTTAIAAPGATETEAVNAEVSQFEKSETETPSVFSASLESQETQTLAQAQQTEDNVLQEVNQYSSEGQENGSQSQVTSVSQFSDVQPTDWAFQALQSLVERYGCIAGYPNGTYRGNRALTRYEFAAGLNACLDRVNELIATATADIITREDLATLQRLQEEFSAELATLRGRVDALEARTAEIEANQFSTTTKLAGEAIFALTDAFGDSVDSNNNTVFQNRIRLDLQTSFTGKDVLHTRLATGNA
ncbi:MAG: iron uptake porin, partial [Rivularia sp. (in: cyanobacteria)]